MNFGFLRLCSSFNDEPVNGATAGLMGKELFEKEEGDLLADLLAIPKKACDRWVRLCLILIFPIFCLALYMGLQILRTLKF